VIARRGGAPEKEAAAPEGSRSWFDVAAGPRRYRFVPALAAAIGTTAGCSDSFG
jgi:hypothetical protein